MLKQLLMGAALLSAAPLLAQTIDPTFTSPASVYANAGVYALGPAQADGKRLLAGPFARLGGQTTGNVARLDNAGALDQAFAQNVGTASNVYRVVAGLGGQYLLGAWGGNIVAGGLTRNEVLRLNADGTADAGFNAGTGPSLGTDPGYGQDYAVQADGKVLVGGYFGTWSGTAAPGLVRLTSTGALDQAFITNLGSGINCAGGDEVRTVVVLPDGKILVGGVFASFGGHAATGLVRLNADGTYDPTFACGLPADSFVTSLLRQPDGNLLLDAHVPSTSGGSGLMRLLPSGTQDATFSCNQYLSDFRNTLDPRLALQPDGKILLVAANGNNFIRLTSTGAADPTFQPSSQPSRTPTAVAVQPDGGILTATTQNTNMYGSLETTIARYGSTGALQTSFAPKPQYVGTVTRVLRLADNSVLAGGNFSEWNGQPVHHLVHLSSNGTYDAAFTANTTADLGFVEALAQQPDGKLLVGAVRLLRLLPSGALDPGFNQTTINNMLSLALQPDGRIVVGSASPAVTLSPAPSIRLVRLTSSGEIDNSFVPATPSGFMGSYVSALALQPDGKVLVAQLSGSASATGIWLFRLSASGSLDNTFTTAKFDGGSRVYTPVLQADGSLLVSGNFTSVNGTAQRGLARVTATGSLDAGFAASAALASGAVNVLALQPNGRVLLGGTFTTSSANGSFSRLGRVLASGQPDNSFAGGSAAPNGQVTGLQVLPDGKLLVSGSFTSIGGQPAIGLARLTAPNVLAVATPGAVAAATAAWPVPAHEVLRVQPAASAHPLAADLLDALGRVVRQQALTGPAEFSFDTSALPAGLYVLRVRYAEGTVSRPLSVE